MRTRLLVLAAVVLLVPACGGSGTSPAPSRPPGTPSGTAAASASGTADPGASGTADASASPAATEGGGTFTCSTPEDERFAIEATVTDETGEVLRCGASKDPDWGVKILDEISDGTDAYVANDPDDPAVVRVGYIAGPCQPTPTASVTRSGDAFRIEVDRGPIDAPPDQGCDTVPQAYGIAFRFGEPVPAEAGEVVLTGD